MIVLVKYYKSQNKITQEISQRARTIKEKDKKLQDLYKDNLYNFKIN